MGETVSFNMWKVSSDKCFKNGNYHTRLIIIMKIIICAGEIDWNCLIFFAPNISGKFHQIYRRLIAYWMSCQNDSKGVSTEIVRLYFILLSQKLICDHRHGSYHPDFYSFFQASKRITIFIVAESVCFAYFYDANAVPISAIYEIMRMF